MSQCHDTYDLLTVPGRADLKSNEAGGEQCHVSYECIGSPAVTGNVHHECHFVHRHRDGACLIRIVGMIDWATAGRFEELMSDASGPVVVIDLTRASMDSAGTGSLICALARAEKRGQRLAIVVTNAPQLEVLRAAGLDSVIEIVQSEPEALKLFAGNPVANERPGTGADRDPAAV